MIEPAPSVPDEPPLQSLDRRWIGYSRGVGLVQTAALLAPAAGAVALLHAAGDLPALPLIAAAAVVLAGLLARAWVWPGIAYRHAAYRLGPRALEVRRGVLWRSIIDVPRARMQHSDVSQGPLERLHGLATLSVFTAGTRYALVRLRGLSRERALEIREHLTQAHGDDVT